MTKPTRQLSLREEQQAELEVMKAIHSYCVSHQLRYVLGYGTLLGAVRHHGFIPWDNDMDILMPREDMEKLIRLEKQEPIHPNVSLFDYTKEEHYHYPIVRACNMNTIVHPSYLREQIDHMGVWVDIFPLDGFSRTHYLLQRPFCRFLMMLLNATIYKLPPNQKIKICIQKIILTVFPNKNHRYEKWLSSICRRNHYDKTDHVCVLCESDTSSKHTIKRSDIDHPILAAFEDATFMIPRNADFYLQKQYGDYMKLPPEKDRIPHQTTSQYL